MVEDTELDPTLADFLADSAEDDEDDSFSFDADDFDDVTVDDADMVAAPSGGPQNSVTRAANAEPYKVDITREQIRPVRETFPSGFTKSFQNT